MLNADTTVEGALALRDINLSIKQGEFVCIIGDVGSGKSSLLNAIIGDLQYLDPYFLVEEGAEKLNDPTTAEKIKSHTRKRVHPSDTPIVIADQIAYVQ